ncbi:PAS domain-containing sensor histidine kinase [Aureimonas sp. AU20]|uniref:PAS domain-containing sensor histidine kinase n=2 Tax=Aureimonas sp. AU20 TaxID=1349819 RepID=UPI0011E00557|nr:HWE histidine kinase domain-containing protein [Aureimonas sp. AU20]
MSDRMTARAFSGAEQDPGKVLPMADQISHHDWSGTPLGSHRRWPQSLHTIVDMMLASGHAICLAWGPEQTFLYNNAYAPFLGARHPQALGRPFAEVWPDVWAEIEPLVTRVYGGETVTFQAMPLIMTRNGYAEDTWWDFSYSPIRDETGEVAGLLNIAADATPRIVAERERDAATEKLRVSESVARANFERVQLALGAGAIIGTWFWDIVADRFTIDEPFARAFGLDPALGREGISLAQIVETVHPDDQVGLADAIKKAVARGGHYAHQYRVRRSDGNYYWLEANGRVDRAPDGTPKMFSGVLIDIAERLAAEDALARSEATWRTVFETLREGFILGEVIRDASGQVVDWRYEAVNNAWHDMLGMPRGTAVGRTVRDLLPDIEDEWINEFARVVETSEPARFTRRVGTLDRWYDGVAQSIGDDRFTVIFVDVTDRIKRERRQATLLTLADELRGRSDLQTIVTAAARCLADGLEVDRVGSGTVNLRQDTIDVQSDWCEQGVPSVVGRHAFSSYGSYLADLRRGDIVAVDDIYEDARTSGRQREFDAIQTRSFLDLPISFDGRLYAVVFAHSRTLHPWTDGERQFVEQVSDRVRVALARQRMEDAQRVLTQEMSHRMKNTLAMVQAIATQTLRQAHTMDEAREAISSRLSALARAQDILTRTNFTEADVREVVEAAIAPHRLAGERVAMSGPRADLSAQQALGLSLAIHELATNAAKYGALSNETGRVDMTWGMADGAFKFHWIETGGPLVIVPKRRGFGSKLIERIVASYFDGEGHIEFDPAGICFTLTGSLVQPVNALKT